jgi:hypothetical protein
MKAGGAPALRTLQAFDISTNAARYVPHRHEQQSPIGMTCCLTCHARAYKQRQGIGVADHDEGKAVPLYS